MKNIIITFLAIAFIHGCGAKSVQEQQPEPKRSIETQQSEADKAYAELDRETGGQTEVEKELEAEIPRDNKPEKKMDSVVPSPRVDKMDSLRPETKYPMKNGYPVWFYNPNYDGYIGAVGISKKQPRGGYVLQKRLAKALAMSELAKTVNVLVESELNITKLNVDTETVKYYRKKVESLSRHKAEEVLKDYELRDEWYNDKTDELYVWMVIRK
ncbi:LPP20 family lipoprotein [Limisalsivibrio acetivorans]|uniref:LPP20 family lipoprotein n=1 Tax=Limisalsivibrio acetivorans TaxID=1304888 RepID=UPI0003B3C0EF|nr:LPP20 family lipoprotein [Limisalsivibrio acetivorans]